MDRATYSEAEFKQLMELKRQDHEKQRQVSREIKYGRFSRPPRRANGVWAPGKEALLSLLRFTAEEILVIVAPSFFDSFLNSQLKPSAQITADLCTILAHPGGFEVMQAFVSNQFVPTHYKLLIAAYLKGKYDELVDYKLGRLFVTVLIEQLK